MSVKFCECKTRSNSYACPLNNNNDTHTSDFD